MPSLVQCVLLALDFDIVSCCDDMLKSLVLFSGEHDTALNKHSSPLAILQMKCLWLHGHQFLYVTMCQCEMLTSRRLTYHQLCAT